MFINTIIKNNLNHNLFVIAMECMDPKVKFMLAEHHRRKSVDSQTTDSVYIHLGCTHYCLSWGKSLDNRFVRFILSHECQKKYLFKQYGIRFNRLFGTFFGPNVLKQNKWLLDIVKEQNDQYDLKRFVDMERANWQKFNNEYYLRGYPTYNQYRQNLKCLLIEFFNIRSLVDVVGIILEYT